MLLAEFLPACCCGDESQAPRRPVQELILSVPTANESCGIEGLGELPARRWPLPAKTALAVSQEDAAAELCADGGSTEASSTYRDSRDFDVVLHGGGTELGIDVNERDQSTLLVTRVMDLGVVPRHNERCRAACTSAVVGPEEAAGVPSEAQGAEIMPGDRIVEVNGVRGHTRRMVARLKADEDLRLTVRRLDEVTVTLSRHPDAAATLGLHAVIDAEFADGMSLRVIRVQRSGIVMDPIVIAPGDRIVALNGHRGNCTRLSWELEDAKLPSELVIRRFRR